ncbi:MAG: cupin domain-containing protein [Vicingaceae bacterium]
MKLIKYLLIPFLFVAYTGNAQIFEIEKMQPDTTFENVFVKKITTDSLSTAFVIWVKKKVPPHYHAKHTENIYVLEGSAEMVIGEQTHLIKKGDYFIIPKGTAHSVIVTSEIPLKILSIQTPEFFGEDRIWIKNQ